MNVVYVVNRTLYEQKLCRARFLAVAPLRPTYTGPGWLGWDDQATVRENLDALGLKPDLILAYKPRDVVGWETAPCPVVMQVNEVNWERLPLEVEWCRPARVVFHHLQDRFACAEMVEQQGGKAVHIPHVADPSIFRHYGLPKDVDFLLVGAIHRRVYPLRVQLRHVVDLLNGRGFRCAVYEHPGYVIERADRCEHLVEFARAVNSAKVVGTCSSVHWYRLQKYVEVPACRSVLAADVPTTKDDMAYHLLTLRRDASVVDLADKVEGLLEQWGSGGVETRLNQGEEYASRYTPEWYCQRLRQSLGFVAGPSGDQVDGEPDRCGE